MIKISNFTRADIPLYEAIACANPMLSPYQASDFLLRYKKTAKLGRTRIFLKNRIIKLSDENFEVLCPISIDKFKKNIYLLGDRSAVGYCDFIYGSELKDEDFDNIFTALKKQYPGYTFRFNKMNESSALCAYLLKHYKPVATNECVNLPLGDDSDLYYHSLSKNARQNIRTAYNRTNRDGKTIDFKVITGKERLTSKEKMKLLVSMHIE